MRGAIELSAMRLRGEGFSALWQGGGGGGRNQRGTHSAQLV